jgi:hypothetical protein
MDVSGEGAGTAESAAALLRAALSRPIGTGASRAKEMDLSDESMISTH